MLHPLLTSPFALRSPVQFFQSEPVERVKSEVSKLASKATADGGGLSLPKVNLPSGGGGGPTLSQLTLPRE